MPTNTSPSPDPPGTPSPEPMTIPDKIQRLYENYLEQARQVEREHRPLDGFMGFGQKTSDDPCHERFVKAVEALLKTAVQENLGSGQALAALEYIYRAPKENRKPLAAYWMLIAVHGQTLELIGQLSREDAGTLWKEYKETYRRRDRLPAQEKVLAALDRARK